MKKILTYTFLVLIILTNPSWSVSCNGYDSDTDAYVWGNCDGGSFSGYDSETDAWVYGDCQPGGELSAYNSDTGSWVWGNCDS